jgi:hypothetical protein
MVWQLLADSCTGANSTHKNLHRLLTTVILQSHHKSVTRADSTDAFDPIADLQDCGQLYEQLEWCLAEHDRKFSKCQIEMKAVKACMEAQAERSKQLRCAGQSSHTT